MRLSFYQQMAAELQRRSSFALGVISSVKGSSPQKKGAKALFFADDGMVGTLGGGCLEAEIRLRARRALKSGDPSTFDLTLDHDYGWDDGLICGGKVSGLILPRAAEAREIWQTLASRDRSRTWGVRPDFFIAWKDEPNREEWLYEETVVPPLSLWIAGSGHIAQSVVPLAQELDFDVTVFDDRPELASNVYFPEGTKFRVGEWPELVTAVPPASGAMGLIVTRGHKHDANVLAAWIRQPFAFLGMIGSSRKWRLIREGFLKSGIATEEQMDQVACPVGLEIGAVSPQEIAVSIMAQLVEKRVALLSA